MRSNPSSMPKGKVDFVLGGDGRVAHRGAREGRARSRRTPPVTILAATRPGWTEEPRGRSAVGEHNRGARLELDVAEIGDTDSSCIALTLARFEHDLCVGQQCHASPRETSPPAVWGLGCPASRQPACRLPRIPRGPTGTSGRVVRGCRGEVAPGTFIPWSISPRMSSGEDTAGPRVAMIFVLRRMRQPDRDRTGIAPTHGCGHGRQAITVRLSLLGETRKK